VRKKMPTDFEFRRQVMDYHISPDLIKYCYQCNRCTDHCPISKVTDDAYNPRRTILNALLGYKEAVFSAKVNIWGCTACDTCDEVCPQDIELTEIFSFIKNISTDKGEAPEFIYSQGNIIYNTGRAIPTQPAIARRRKLLNLPPVPETQIVEVQTLLDEAGLVKILDKEGKLENVESI
jgi:heterodisulfide reductase subunit C